MCFFVFSLYFPTKISSFLKTNLKDKTSSEHGKQLLSNTTELTWPTELWELLDCLLTVDQFDRYSAKEALMLPFFANCKVIFSIIFLVLNTFNLLHKG